MKRRGTARGIDEESSPIAQIIFVLLGSRGEPLSVKDLIRLIEQYGRSVEAFEVHRVLELLRYARLVSPIPIASAKRADQALREASKIAARLRGEVGPRNKRKFYEAKFTLTKKAMACFQLMTGRSSIARLNRTKIGESGPPIQAELTMQQAADYLGVSLSFIAEKLDDGRISFRGAGKRRRILIGDLRRYLRQLIADRKLALDELARESQLLGLGH